MKSCNYEFHKCENHRDIYFRDMFTCVTMTTVISFVHDSITISLLPIKKTYLQNIYTKLKGSDIYIYNIWICKKKHLYVVINTLWYAINDFLQYEKSYNVMKRVTLCYCNSWDKHILYYWYMLLICFERKYLLTKTILVYIININVLFIYSIWIFVRPNSPETDTYSWSTIH